jgi:hypothetical protein
MLYLDKQKTAQIRNTLGARHSRTHPLLDENYCIFVENISFLNLGLVILSLLLFKYNCKTKMTSPFVFYSFLLSSPLCLLSRLNSKRIATAQIAHLQNAQASPPPKFANKLFLLPAHQLRLVLILKLVYYENTRIRS